MSDLPAGERPSLNQATRKQKARRFHMKPRRDNAATPDSTAKQQKEKEKSRFQIVKLEERIAPNKGGIDHKSIHRCI
jgi:hypothetical protein